jgi:hypothetical protein
MLQSMRLRESYFKETGRRHRRRVLRRIVTSSAVSSVAGRVLLLPRMIVEGVDRQELSGLTNCESTDDTAHGVASDCDGRRQQQVASIHPHLQQNGANISSKSNSGCESMRSQSKATGLSPPSSPTSSFARRVSLSSEIESNIERISDWTAICASPRSIHA